MSQNELQRVVAELTAFVQRVSLGMQGGCGCRPVCRCLEPEAMRAWGEGVEAEARAVLSRIEAAQAVAPGEDAVEWQRRVGGHWQNIDRATYERETSSNFYTRTNEYRQLYAAPVTAAYDARPLSAFDLRDM